MQGGWGKNKLVGVVQQGQASTRNVGLGNKLQLSTVPLQGCGYTLIDYIKT